MLKALSINELRDFAENASRLAEIIRHWLPVAGESEPKSGSWRTAEQWFYRAGEHFTACERVRNPRKLPFDPQANSTKVRGGSYYGPSACSAAWFELERALDEVAVAYRLQRVADESGCPHLPHREPVPAIEPGTLRRLELASSEILAAVLLPPETDADKPGQVGRSKKSFGPPEDVQAVMRMMTLKRWAGKNPIDVCRECTRQKNSKADSDTIEREAQSLKRKVNRYKK